MRILIQPPHETTDLHVVSDEVRKALDVLSSVHIRTDAGGTIESDDGAVVGVLVLRSDDDAARALAALAHAGIIAMVS
jgi:hypothetical protein